MPENLRRYKYLWSKCHDEKIIRAAWKKLRKGKTKRHEVIEIERDFDHYVKLMQETMIQTRPGGDEALMFKPRAHTGRTVYEHGKERRIFCPAIWEQWVHHIVVMVLAPIITKYSYRYSCGSMPNRGSIYGKKYMEKLARDGFRYFAKLDIRHFFNNVRLEVVIRELNLLIEDDWLIFLIRRIFLYFPKGLPLGFYISQWFANFVLWRMDQAILAAEPHGYLRYMDDMVITGNNKRKLHKIVILVMQWLGGLKLRLKSNWTVTKFIYKKKDGKIIGRTIDFMGFQFLRDRTILRKKIMIRATRYAAKLRRLPVIGARQALSMVSRAGWFKHTDTSFVWFKYIKPFISIKAMKGIISKTQRRRNNENRVVQRDVQRISGDLRPA